MAPTPSIQAMDVTSLRAVLAEMRRSLLPSRFEKAQQPDAHRLQLGLRSLRGTLWLELSWLAEAPRLLVVEPPLKQGEGSTLAQQLQHGLRGLALVSLEQQGWERVVALGFAPRPGEPIRRQLVLELMGRHSNLFLIDEEQRVIALARQVRQDRSRLRPIGTGDPYQPPPPMAGEPPRLEEEVASWRRRLGLLPQTVGEALMGAYQGIGPALARQLAQDALARPVQSLEEEAWQRLWQRWRLWLETVAEERFQLGWGGPSDYRCWDPEGPPADDDWTINRGLAGYYADRLGHRELEQRRASLRQRLLNAAARERRNAEQQQSLLAAVPGSEAMQRRADGLLSLPSPSREEIDEAQRLYRRARKLRRSVAAITPRLELHQQRLAAIEASLTFLEQAENGAQLAAVEEDLPVLLPARDSQGPGPSRRVRRGAAGAAPAPLELRSSGGLRLQVGRNHRQNEWISLQQARRGDLWFHAQECPGSHVVLKGSEGTPGEADLREAADLAAHFSRGRANGRVPVVMVPTTDLQRIAGAGPGTVRHRGGEVLWAVPERAAGLLTAPPRLPGTEQP
ncbi:NFACT family protein [Cyanobium sp. Candia 9D4]|uniref:Rqc2 family fibronectin-binding protein n=1 Tax=Cyanobium sp. Candia 9D4 TaxID=2823707 RepID=UPI0020CB80CB|nr:NFACT RNA binding domain-containing protein [Cyanobium sp. Candia 9D4]MCP9932363.1 NFACT family protein [Cyanobium sp. Candia 9D4]